MLLSVFVINIIAGKEGLSTGSFFIFSTAFIL